MLVSLVVDTAAESSGGVSSEDEEEGGGEVVYGATDLSFEAVPYNETSFASLPPQTPNFGAHMVDVGDVAPGKEGERGGRIWLETSSHWCLFGLRHGLRQRR